MHTETVLTVYFTGVDIETIWDLMSDLDRRKEIHPNIVEISNVKKINKSMQRYVVRERVDFLGEIDFNVTTTTKLHHGLGSASIPYKQPFFENKFKW